MSQCLQFPSQFRGIIEFSVIDDGVMLPVVFQFHGLCTSCRVDHRQPGVKQRHIPIPVNTLSVRSPAQHGMEHFFSGIFP